MMRMVRRPGTPNAGGALGAWEMQWAARCSVVLASLYKAMPLSLMVCSLRATTQTEVGMTKKCGCKVDDLGHCRNWWPDAAPRSPSSKLTVWSATAVCAGLQHIVVWCRSSAHAQGGLQGVGPCAGQTLMRMMRRPGTPNAGGALRAWEMQWAARRSVVMASLYQAMPPSLMVCSLRATAQTEVGITKKCGFQS